MKKLALICAALAFGLAAGLACAEDSEAPVNSNDYRATETSLIHNNSSAKSTNGATTNGTRTNAANTTNTNPASSDRETPERSNEPITQQQSNRYDVPQSGTSHDLHNNVKSVPSDVKEKVQSVTPGAH